MKDFLNKLDYISIIRSIIVISAIVGLTYQRLADHIDAVQYMAATNEAHSVERFAVLDATLLRLDHNIDELRQNILTLSRERH